MSDTPFNVAVSGPLETTPKPWLDANGKFAPGNAGGGRPRRKVIRKMLMRALYAANDAGVKAGDIMVRNQVRLAAGEGGTAVAAFEAIRDTVDGKPASEDAGNQVGIAVSLRFIGGRDGELEAALKS